MSDKVVVIKELSIGGTNEGITKTGSIKAEKQVVSGSMTIGGWEDYVLTGWPKPAPKPDKGGDQGNPRDGGGTGCSRIKTGVKGSTSFGIKHLSDPTWVSGDWGTKHDGSGWVIKVEKQIDISGDPTETINQEDWFGPVSPGPGYIKVGGSGVSKPVTGDIVYFDKLLFGGDGEGGFIPVIWKGGSQLGIILKVGGDHDINGDSGSLIIEDPTDTINGDDQYDAATEYGGRTSEDINDPWLIEGGGGMDHEWHIDGDFDISQQDWFGPATGPNPVPNEGEGGYIEGDYGFSGGDHDYVPSGWPKPEPEPTPAPFSGDWGFSGVWDKQDTTGLSSHTSTFRSGDWGI